MTIALLNTSILAVTAEDVPPLSAGGAQFRLVLLSEQAAQDLVRAEPVQSFIGHASTAAELSGILGIPVDVNRNPFRHAVGQTALIYKLRGRAPEGKILSLEEMRAMGYDLFLLVRDA